MLKKTIILIFGFAIMFFGQTGFAAATDIYAFDSPKQQARFDHLGKQFRCLVCQNETLADSTAPLARDLRFQIYQMVKENKTNEQITQFLVDRYGDFVVFKPRISKYTFLLWAGPFIMLLAALARILWLVAHRTKKFKPPKSSYRFTKEDRERIRHLLSQY